MRITKEIPLGNIKMDRLPLNKKTLDLVVFLSNGGVVPAIKVAKVGSSFEIRDGRHRWLAYKLLGYQTIPAHYGVPSVCPNGCRAKMVRGVCLDCSYNKLVRRLTAASTL